MYVYNNKDSREEFFSLLKKKMMQEKKPHAAQTNEMHFTMFGTVLL